LNTNIHLASQTLLKIFLALNFQSYFGKLFMYSFINSIMKN
jgi:hypothetical protein